MIHPLKHRKYKELQKQTKELCKSAYNTYGHFYNLGTYYVLTVTLVIRIKQQRCRHNNLYTRIDTSTYKVYIVAFTNTCDI